MNNHAESTLSRTTGSTFSPYERSIKLKNEYVIKGFRQKTILALRNLRQKLCTNCSHNFNLRTMKFGLPLTCCFGY